MGGNDTTSAGASRAKSYFLVPSMVGNSSTFAIGPRLLDDEEAPDKCLEEQNKQEEDAHANERIEGDEEHAKPLTALTELLQSICVSMMWLRSRIF